MKILLIAGHGAGDGGAVGNGCKEAELTREVVKLLKAQLDNYADVDIADMSKNWYKSRNALNARGYGYALEVHFNAVKADCGDGKTKGTEIYVTTSEKGTTVEQGIVDNISAVGLTNRGVKRKDWAVIKHIKNQGVSSALLEVCFIDDADDMKIYTSKKHEIISAIAKGIIDGFNLKVNDTEAVTVLKNRVGLEQQTVDYLLQYKYGKELTEKLARAIKE